MPSATLVMAHSSHAGVPFPDRLLGAAPLARTRRRCLPTELVAGLWSGCRNLQMLGRGARGGDRDAVARGVVVVPVGEGVQEEGRSASQRTSWWKTLLTMSGKMRRTAIVALGRSTSNWLWRVPVGLKRRPQLRKTAKNRYRNEEPDSDYINASFMPGLENPQEFIAAQGPLPQTVGDFWRLVWEQQSGTLVMLTNCVESRQVKCEHYWPLDAKPCTHGHLQVTLEDARAENTTSVSVPLRDLARPRRPPLPRPHAGLLEDAAAWAGQDRGGRPPILHCSAGMGRTGTLIASDVLLRQLERDGCVGPFSYVQKMRESRPLMVHTEAQYVFLHQCILRFLQQSGRAPTDNGAVYENLLYENV
ncbi:hypothetical protein GH733_017288 [Mirounga leonina]|nr:hypothetical protein GH733_017288 [Mirounga leonina]